jgi:DivIVA domain-containing protein
MSGTDPTGARISPHDVRRKHFTARLRGADSGEVRSFLTRVADDLEGLQAQVAKLTNENVRLSAEVAEAREDLQETRATPMEHATDQAVSVLNQAQQLADSLIDEAMQSARDLLLTARSQQKDIMEQAKVAAKGAVSRATSIAGRASIEDPSVKDVEYIRMFAKVAQVQFQAVLDALNEHVNRLGELSGTTEPANRPAELSATTEPANSDQANWSSDRSAAGSASNDRWEPSQDDSRGVRSEI